jgi:hypothetical protein
MAVGNIIVLGFGIIFMSIGSETFLVLHLFRNEDKENYIKESGTIKGFDMYRPKN